MFYIVECEAVAGGSIVKLTIKIKRFVISLKSTNRIMLVSIDSRSTLCYVLSISRIQHTIFMEFVVYINK